MSGTYRAAVALNRRTKKLSRKRFFICQKFTGFELELDNILDLIMLTWQKSGQRREEVDWW